jgi:thiol-disulfide isomerase/thioredoxin
MHSISTKLRWSLAVAALLAISIDGAQARPPAAIGSDFIPASGRKMAADFTITDVNGKQIQLSRLKGRVVLLDFWATTCGGCKVELPWYVEFDSKYRGKGLSLVGLDMYGETAEVIKPFMVKWHMDYPVAIGTDELGDKFGLKEMPLTLLIDRSGRIAVAHSGIVDKATFEGELQRLLRE